MEDFQPLSASSNRPEKKGRRLQDRAFNFAQDRNLVPALGVDMIRLFTTP